MDLIKKIEYWKDFLKIASLDFPRLAPLFWWETLLLFPLLLEEESGSQHLLFLHKWATVWAEWLGEMRGGNVGLEGETTKDVGTQWRQ